MHSYFLFKTKNNNRYLYDCNKRKIIYCSPAFFLFLKGILFKKKTRKENFLDFLHPGETPELFAQKFNSFKENGFFNEIEYDLSLRLNKEDIQQAIANTNQITFEVTENCNLNCKYCGYGYFYNNVKPREKKELTIENAIQLLKFVLDKTASTDNISCKKEIYISFYGGEPLLRFPFIKEIVECTESQKHSRNNIKFSITTNGLLLRKHISYLVEKDFSILVSLDGNKKGNSYRVYNNGKESYEDLIDNLHFIQKKYPEYFEKKLNFNVVLHNRNVRVNLYEFFKSQFNKIPEIAELNSNGVAKEKLKEFETMFEDAFHFDHKQKKSINPEKQFSVTSTIKSTALFLHKMCDHCFTDYNDLYYNSNKLISTPTGTCFPFSKKLFIAADGRIFPCERIGNIDELGNIENSVVNIYYDKILKIYNTFSDSIEPLCKKCYRAKFCSQCMFNINKSEKGKPVCQGFINYTDFSNILKGTMEYLEDNPELISPIFNEIILDF